MNLIELPNPDALRNLLDTLNEAGVDPSIAGTDAMGSPFLIVLDGPYGETEAVVMGNPYDSEVGPAHGYRCEECRGHENSSMKDLHFPVHILIPGQVVVKP
jgi:hypothetical protein